MWNQLETLEDRCLMSAGPAQVYDLTTVTAQAVSAGPGRAANVNQGSFLGKYKGTIQTSIRPRPFKATLNIRSVTRDGKVTGTIQHPKIGNVDFTIPVTGKITRSGHFTVTYRYAPLGINGRIEGDRDGNDVVTGDFRVSGNALPQTVTGTFTFTRLRPAGS
jgi:hypothetical protein